MKHILTVNHSLAGFNFIDRSGEHDDEDVVRRGIRDLHRKRLDEEDEQSPEQIAQALKGRYGGRSANRYTGDMNEIPQRLLMPSVHDVFLWQVRVKVC
jgi:transcription elongation factor SPT5